jgi:hypothetical protein
VYGFAGVRVRVGLGNPRVTCAIPYQRLSDSWCNVIGSAGIAVLLAFCDTQEILQDSDEERVEFAKYYLENLRFLYRESEHDDKKVCDPECSLFVLIMV